MKITLNLNDELVKKARELTGIKEKTALIHRGLELLIQDGGVDSNAVSGDELIGSFKGRFKVKGDLNIKPRRRHR